MCLRVREVLLQREARGSVAESASATCLPLLFCIAKTIFDIITATTFLPPNRKLGASRAEREVAHTLHFLKGTKMLPLLGPTRGNAHAHSSAPSGGGVFRPFLIEAPL